MLPHTIQIPKTAAATQRTKRAQVASPSAFERAWSAAPEWVFATAGVLYLLIPLAIGFWDYRDFWSLGPYYVFDDGSVLQMPFVRVLGDWTAVLVMLGFMVRRRPVARNTRVSDIAIGMLGSFWTYTPFVIVALCQLADSAYGTDWAQAFRKYWMADRLSAFRLFAGTGLIVVGTMIDIWGYAYLLRSFSQTPEARELRVTGPYRLIRHPIYFGHFLVQGGFYLFLAQRNTVWIAFFLCFCAFQLRRAWREEKVLEAAFGERYLRWKAKTFWIWR